MTYLELCFTIPADDDTREMFSAMLGELGCDSFMEDETFFRAYCPEESFDRPAVESLLQMPLFTGIQLKSVEPMIDQNWNAIWESSYDPVIINKQCRIRAPFHEADPAYTYDILIEPRMSFGTAHHETTAQIIALLFETELQNKQVLDMGSGTAVLAILAMKLGAAHAVAIDNDEWAFNNAKDNVRLNHIEAIDVELGDANTIGDRRFEVILANINRNILLADLPAYQAALLPQGMILLSGFYLDDLPDIKAAAEKLGLAYQKHTDRNNWVAAVFKKNQD